MLNRFFSSFVVICVIILSSFHVTFGIDTVVESNKKSGVVKVGDSEVKFSSDKDFNKARNEVSGDASRLAKEQGLRKKVIHKLKSKRVSSAVAELNTLSKDYYNSVDVETYNLELLYAQYMAGDYDDAVATADGYIVLYSQQKHIDYVLYMKARSLMKSYVSNIPKGWQLFFGGHDKQPLEDAKITLNVLLERYPDSSYFYASSVLLDEINENLASRSFTIAKENSNRKAYFASQERLKDVLWLSKSNSLIYKSLKLMTYNYEKMGLTAEKKSIDSIIKLNLS